MPVKELCGPSKAQDLQIEVSTRAEGWALAGERGGLRSEGRGEAGRGGFRHCFHTSPPLA